MSKIFAAKYLRRTKLRVTAIEDKVAVDAHTVRARTKKENKLVRLSECERIAQSNSLYKRQTLIVH